LFSERRLRRVALWSVAGIALATLAFHEVQNREALTGGAVAWPKSVWLGCAILFWIVLPALLTGDARLGTSWRTPFALLLMLMLLRGAIELWMLYVSHTWSPFYGIAHDAVCVAVLWWFARRAVRGVPFGQLARLERTAFVHAIATGALFVPEMYFAWYMQANFRTQGDDPLYFVPDDPAHAGVLALTTMADAAAVLYLPGFLYAWLYGKTEIAGARAQRVER
jgi:hypothetical protein